MIRMITERCIEMQRGLYPCFIDYEKVFHSVKHEELLKCMENIELDRRDMGIYQNMFSDQESAIRAEREMGIFFYKF